jgi:hypothetical protein
LDIEAIEAIEMYMIHICRGWNEFSGTLEQVTEFLGVKFRCDLVANTDPSIRGKYLPFLKLDAFINIR